MSYTCESCSKRKPGEPVVTVIGRRICPDCDRGILGLATGMTASGGDVGTSAGIASWFRNRTRKRDE
ncbi:hypothetical protein [Agrococcus sp. ARC_14]|uniref:hypothetical protein n=1 Tax=Agrococcus sp. ARC_14 TaxID=2919927 RepID=UPI001F05AF8E|nr:hypothetical protein [Agrococcus sp. ARC_14]MCH1883287.1 hypothetical protein [Agrococcus sp. ARC_14]